VLIDARLMCRAACMDMGVSTSRPSLVKDYSTLGDMAPRTNKRVVFDTTESHRVVRMSDGRFIRNTPRPA
jgi:hypothetical protein